MRFRFVQMLLAASALATGAGLTSRTPWSGGKLAGSPEPPSPYRVQLAFPKLRFERPTAIVSAPGSDRLFVTNLDGGILSFPNRRDAAETVPFLDLGPGTLDARTGRRYPRQIQDIAFHPEYARNGYVYAFITENWPLPRRTRVSRFERDRRDPLRADPASEVYVLEFPSAGHNGGAIEFGPDGYLYIGTGDGGGQYDTLNTGQFLGDLLSSILRIDVNGSHAAKLYAIPPDNPFLHTPGAMPEIFAYGFRQPWKMSFDRKGGGLWVGEVGQDLWESIHLVRKGGNYGWSVSEGSQMARPDKRQGPTPISAPVVAHSHSEARSITGGYVYHGAKLPDLRGAYVYADWETGRVWALRHDGAKVTEHRELDDTTLDIAAFGEDNAGELYLLTHHDGRVYELVRRAGEPDRSAEFPRLLSQTGLFDSTRDMKPAPGLIPYSVNAPLWSDGAGKERYLALPGAARIQYASHDQWLFPEGSALVKTFFLGKRRIETRVLTLRPGAATREQWAGYVYVWNDAQTDAELLGKEGEERTYTFDDAAAPGGKRTQRWQFPSRNDCLVCHNEKARFLLGLNTPQMNRQHDYGGERANQIETLRRIGLFEGAPTANVSTLPRLPEPGDASLPVDRRARSYLQGNCAHCHQFGAGGNSDIRLQFGLALDKTYTVGGDPFHGDMGVKGARILVPGKPAESVLYLRMAARGAGRMPHIASKEPDRDALGLIGEWIRTLKPARE